MQKDKLIYEETTKFPEYTERFVIFENRNMLYLSVTKSTKNGARGIYRRATLEDHMRAVEVQVERMKRTTTH